MLALPDNLHRARHQILTASARTWDRLDELLLHYWASGKPFKTTFPGEIPSEASLDYIVTPGLCNQE